MKDVGVDHEKSLLLLTHLPKPLTFLTLEYMLDYFEFFIKNSIKNNPKWHEEFLKYPELQHALNTRGYRKKIQFLCEMEKSIFIKKVMKSKMKHQIQNTKCLDLQRDFIPQLKALVKDPVFSLLLDDIDKHEKNIISLLNLNEILTSFPLEIIQMSKEYLEMGERGYQDDMMKCQENEFSLIFKRFIMETSHGFPEIGAPILKYDRRGNVFKKFMDRIILDIYRHRLILLSSFLRLHNRNSNNKIFIELREIEKTLLESISMMNHFPH